MKIPKAALEKILGIAIHAPSGDNSQPWRFNFHEAANELFISNIHDADDSPYNFRQRGSYVAHGALLENIHIAARHHGWLAADRLFPDSSDKTVVASVTFRDNPAGPEPQPLYPYIPERCTDRKPYDAKKPAGDIVKKIKASAEEQGTAALYLLEDSEKISRLAQELSFNERLMLENFYVHQGIFGIIRWNKNDEQATKTGLYVKTLELNPAQEAAFRILKHWQASKFLTALGMGKAVAKDTARLYAATPVYGLLTIPDDKDAAFINLGRSLQRIWLTATQFGLRMQPTTAMLYLHQRLAAGEEDRFSPEATERIRGFVKLAQNLFGAASSIPAMLFRLGYGPEPTSRSLKKNLQIHYYSA